MSSFAIHLVKDYALAKNDIEQVLSRVRRGLCQPRATQVNRCSSPFLVCALLRPCFSISRTHAQCIASFGECMRRNTFPTEL
jgi:hypothetical protein